MAMIWTFADYRPAMSYNSLTEYKKAGSLASQVASDNKTKRAGFLAKGFFSLFREPRCGTPGKATSPWLLVLHPILGLWRGYHCSR